MTNESDYFGAIPHEMPRTHNPASSKLARWAMRMCGWRFEGEVPAVSKAIVIIAPHTSNWDFFILLMAKFALQVKASYVMKREAFFWPFKGWLIAIGGIPIDRSQPARIVNQVIREIHSNEKIWIVITPEGTRKKVAKYKSGFIRIAHGAGVPVIVVGLDYAKKAVVFARTTTPTGKHEEDVAEIQQFCRTNFVARHPEYQ